MAQPPPGQSLRARLATLITVVAVVVVSGGALVQTRVYDWRAEQAVLEAGETVAREVAGALARASTMPDLEALHRLLERAESVADVQRVGALVRDGQGRFAAGSSSAAFTATEQATAQSVLERRVDAWSPEVQGVRSFATPIWRDGTVVGAAVATVSLRVEHEVATRGRLLVLWFSAASAVVLVVLVTLVERRLIHEPLHGILSTLQRYADADFSARAPVVRADEIGQVATALNAMLTRIDHLHASLTERVDEATAELRRANDDLVKSYQRTFALREALARAEQTAAAGQTAANLAHQLGTPLNLISGYIQIMREDADCDPRHADRLRSMEEQVKRVTGYIRTTLDAVRRPDLPKAPIQAGTLLHRLVETARPRLSGSRIAIEARIADNLPVVLGDAVRLELALLNLVNNALDAMTGGGTLTIVGEGRGPDLHIEIRDTGSGIAEDLLPRIFDPWITTKPPGQGTGLGLSIARDVVNGHGGRMGVTSAPGSGTTFTIDLPGILGAPAVREA